eukprot:952562_1
MTEKAQDSINIIHKFGIANLNAKKPLTVNNKYNRTPISSKFFRFPESSLRDNITKHMKEYSMTLDTLLSVKAEQFTKYNPKKKDVIKARVDYFRLQVLEMKESESEESKQSPSDPLPNHSPNMSSSISQASSMSPSNPLSNHPPTMSPSISKKLDEIQELIKSQTYVIGNKYYDDKVAKVKKYYDDKLVKWESEHTKELTNLQNQLLKSREANSTKTQIIKNHKRSIANLKQQKSDNHIITPRVSNKRNDARHRNSIRKHIGAEQEIELCDELRNDNRNLDEHLKESYRPEFEKETNQKICSESRDAVKNIPAMVAHHAGYEGYGTKIIKEKSATSKALHKSRVHFINQPEHTFLKMEPIEDDPIATNRGATRHVSYPDYIKGILLFYTNDPGNRDKCLFSKHRLKADDLSQGFTKQWHIKWYRSKDAQPVQGFKETSMSIFNERHNGYVDGHHQKSHIMHPSEALLCGDTSPFCRKRYSLTDQDMKDIETNGMRLDVNVDGIKGQYLFKIEFKKTGDWKTAITDTHEIGPNGFCVVAKVLMYIGGDKNARESYEWITPDKYQFALRMDKFVSSQDHLKQSVMAEENTHGPYVTWSTLPLIVLWTDVIDERVRNENDNRVTQGLELMTPTQQYEFRKKQCKELKCPYYARPEPFSIHSDICPLHAIIQTASHEIGDLAQEANDSWNLVRKEIIYEYWLQHKDLHIVIGKQLKNDIESNEVVALHIPGNESKYALRETQHWLASLDPHLTEPHQKMKVGVRLVKSIMIREIMYNALKDTFKRGYDCWAINYVIKLCFKMGWIIQLFDPNSGYPYIWWIVFCLGSALKEHVQESPLNRGLAEALLQSHERLNCEFKLKCKRNNNHTIAGLVFIMESLGIKRIGGQELNYFLDTNVSGQAKFKLLSDDLHRTYVEFDETVATLSLDLQRIVNTLRRMKTGDPIPPALKPFVEDVELDAQIQQLERIKQKRIKREQRMLAKKLKNVIALDGDGIDEEKIKGVMDGFLLEQLRKEANKENALPVVYKQRNDRSKRRRMNTSNDNL